MRHQDILSSVFNGYFQSLKICCCFCQGYLHGLQAHLNLGSQRRQGLGYFVHTGAAMQASECVGGRAFDISHTNSLNLDST